MMMVVIRSSANVLIGGTYRGSAELRFMIGSILSTHLQLMKAGGPRPPRPRQRQIMKINFAILDRIG